MRSVSMGGIFQASQNHGILTLRCSLTPKQNSLPGVSMTKGSRSYFYMWFRKGSLLQAAGNNKNECLSLNVEIPGR